MNRQDEAGETFEPHRRRLTGLAYRMLGSLSEAEDIVQEAYLRWHAAERERVGNPRAYLLRTVARLCLDHLKSARARRETYVGPWLPEPIIDETALSPETASELADDPMPLVTPVIRICFSFTAQQSRLTDHGSKRDDRRSAIDCFLTRAASCKACSNLWDDLSEMFEVIPKRKLHNSAMGRHAIASLAEGSASV
jgi:DNA-directed RNA polymerase specialized sigma24 family protein